MSREGVIKFQCNWQQSGNVVNDSQFEAINKYRQLLYHKQLIGADDEDIGFGNISIRTDNNSFLISGSATGKYSVLGPEHYTQVTSYNIAENSLECTGPIKASSESLSHAVIYLTRPDVQAVIHIHSDQIWKAYINKLPTTSEAVEYGTPDMAFSIAQCIKQSRNDSSVIVMGGHPQGIIAYGKSLEEAHSSILSILGDSLV